MANDQAGRWEAELGDFAKESFEADGKRRDVFRIGSGPAVIVISEMPGLTPLVAQFGRRVAAAGCTAVLPVLFGDPGRPMSAGYALQSMGPACVSREFSAFALKRTSPITGWLRKLAAAEHERCGGPGVGAVGMCFTGGFALAMMVDDIMLAPVLSQPSLPLPLSKKFKADIGISDEDLARVKERTAAGACVLGLRFTNDPFCFEERFETLRRELATRDCVHPTRIFGFVTNMDELMAVSDLLITKPGGLTASEALALGLVNHVVAHDDLIPFRHRLLLFDCK